MCALSIKVPIGKSLETYLMILVYVYAHDIIVIVFGNWQIMDVAVYISYNALTLEKSWTDLDSIS